jgi:hypothetical protein
MAFISPPRIAGRRQNETQRNRWKGMFEDGSWLVKTEKYRPTVTPGEDEIKLRLPKCPYPALVWFTNTRISQNLISSHDCLSSAPRN